MSILAVIGPFIGVFVVWLVINIALAMKGIELSSFNSAWNFKTILQQCTLIGIAALGMTLIIIAGGIDLSIGSMLALGTVVTALTLQWFAGGETGGEVGIGAALVAALLCVVACGICGAVNGGVSAYCGIVPFIVTLGMMQIVRGVAKGMSGSQTVYCPESPLNELMVIPDGFTLSPGVFVLIALSIAAHLLLTRTVFGRHVVAIGSNENTARLCGINVKFMRAMVFMLGGLFTGIAAALQFSKLGQGTPTEGVMFELDVIAAVVIGGGSLSGGKGSIVGSIAGALIIAMLRNGFTIVGIPEWVQLIVIGSIIVVAVGVDQIRHK